MPTLSTWAVRASLLYLVAGTTLGAALMAGKAVALPPGLWALRPLHVEALLFGFVVQLVFGVAYWILPRLPGEKARPSGRPVALALGLLNAGVWLVAVAPLSPWGGAVVAGRGCEAAACGVFARHVWPRVRAARAHGGERKPLS